MRIEGGCYCGEIRYVSNGDAQASVQCHCRECQYITGGHPNVLMIMPLDGFKFLSGKPKEFKRNDLKVYIPSWVYNNNKIWGLTAMITADFLRICFNAQIKTDLDLIRNYDEY